MQVGRTLFFLWAVRDAPVQMRRNFQRILVWLSLSGVFWIAGGLADGSAEDNARFTLWSVALLLEFVSPLLYFHVPGLGRSSTRRLGLDPHHLAERCALFVIIALGESLLVTGATFSELTWDRDDDRRLRFGIFRQRGDVVDLLRHQRAARLAIALRVRPIPAASRATHTPICICRSSPASSCARSPTSLF